MIVEVTVPDDTDAVKYGKCSFMPDDTNKLQVPDYVAKTLLGVAGVTGPAQASSAAALLAASDSDGDCETNYVFWSRGKPVPDDGKLAASIALFGVAGEPSASLS